jgi:hypothetical protein
MNKHTKIVRVAIILSSLTLLIVTLGRPVFRGVAVEDVVLDSRGMDVSGLVASDIAPGPRGESAPDLGFGDEQPVAPNAGSDGGIG